MRINEFFARELGAATKHTVSAWGALDVALKRVFLRVWDDHIHVLGNQEVVEVMWDNMTATSPGANERREHVKMIESKEWKSFAVRCTGSGHPVRIRGFRSDVVWPIQGLKKVKLSGRMTTVAILGEAFPVEWLRSKMPSERSRISKDLGCETIDAAPETEREELRQARRGQGKFRSDLMARWDHRCAVTGCEITEIVRASHAKAWCESTNEERLNPANGLPLIATLDALFDEGLISFSDIGKMLVSSTLTTEQVRDLGLRRPLRRCPDRHQKPFLRWHRQNRFR